MTAKYWIKLYHEILHDPKMARMPDNLWRRCIELFLMAGETDEDGILPSIADIAWGLRVDAEHLETEMIELQNMGILSMVDGKWFVTKFVERQAALPKAEYMRRKRNDEQRQEYYQPVTNSNTDKKREDKDKKASTPANFSPDVTAERVYELVTGQVVIPGKNRDNDIHTIRQLMALKGSDVVAYLSPFWEEWINRKYFKGNTAWLEWAVSGDIPQSKNTHREEVPSEVYG